MIDEDEEVTDPIVPWIIEMKAVEGIDVQEAGYLHLEAGATIEIDQGRTIWTSSTATTEEDDLLLAIAVSVSHSLAPHWLFIKIGHHHWKQHETRLGRIGRKEDSRLMLLSFTSADEYAAVARMLLQERQHR